MSNKGSYSANDEIFVFDPELKKKGSKFEMEIEQLRIQSVVNWSTLSAIETSFKKAFYIIFFCTSIHRVKWNRICTDVSLVRTPWTSIKFTPIQIEMHWFHMRKHQSKSKGRRSHTDHFMTETKSYFSPVRVKSAAFLPSPVNAEGKFMVLEFSPIRNESFTLNFN